MNPERKGAEDFDTARARKNTDFQPRKEQGKWSGISRQMFKNVLTAFGELDCEDISSAKEHSLKYYPSNNTAIFAWGYNYKIKHFGESIEPSSLGEYSCSFIRVQADPQNQTLFIEARVATELENGVWKDKERVNNAIEKAFKNPKVFAGTKCD